MTKRAGKTTRAAQSAAPTTKQQRGRPFPKGTSGNPKGRKPGSRNAAVAALDAIGTEAADKILRAVIRQAQRGDVQAAAVILKRVWPERKGSPVVLDDMPSPTNPASIVGALARITAAVAEGKLTPEEGNAVSGILDNQRRALDLLDHENRLKALELHAGAKRGK